MPATTKSYRYQLPAKAIKVDCPQCGPRHRKTLSRYVDSRTGETLPQQYGRCDRESSCGYLLSPYHKTASGLSYADEQKAPPLPKAWFRMAGKQKRNGVHSTDFVQCLMKMEGATREQAERVANYVFDKPTQLAQPTQPAPIYSLPDEVFTQSLGHHDRNQFARLLIRQFGKPKADELLQLFQIGTSARWPGACVFWYIDEHGRKRGGQIKLFDETFHTAKYIDREGKERSKTSWVHSALTYRIQKAGLSVPDWLTEYNQYAECSPCLFGLPQLPAAPIDQPVALVESPKTAVVCSVLMPDFVWMAVGALSYLNAERLAPLRGRTVMLYPDLSKDGTAFTHWSKKANELNKQGFRIDVSDFLEQKATDEQRKKGLDLADYLLDKHKGHPPDWGTPNPPDAKSCGSADLLERGAINEQREDELDNTPDVVTGASLRGVAYDADLMQRRFWQLWLTPPLAWNPIQVVNFIRRCCADD